MIMVGDSPFAIGSLLPPMYCEPRAARSILMLMRTRPVLDPPTPLRPHGVGNRPPQPPDALVPRAAARSYKGPEKCDPAEHRTPEQAALFLDDDEEDAAADAADAAAAAKDEF